MSRRCPKRNHLFFSWLKANSSRFSFAPIVTGRSKRQITGYLSGITKAIQFHIYRGSHIDVVVWNNSKNHCYIGEFLFWGKRNHKGFYAEWFDPSNCIYYPTRADLWVSECFEPFLVWCNETLAANQYVALYSDVNDCYTKAKLQNTKLATENMMLQKVIPTLLHRE